MVWDTFLTPWSNINSNWIKDLNGRLETTKHLEENMAIHTLTLTLANFFWYVSSVKGNKQKSINGTTSSYKTFVQQRKLSIKQKKNPYTKWKKIFENEIYNKRLISKIYKELHTLNIKITNSLTTDVEGTSLGKKERAITRCKNTARWKNWLIKVNRQKEIMRGNHPRTKLLERLKDKNCKNHIYPQ